MTTTTEPGLARGLRAPDMVLPTPDGTPTRYYALAGGQPALLVHALAGDTASLRELASALADVRDELTVHVIGPAELADADLDLPVLVDANGRAAEAYQTQGRTVAFLLSENLRIQQTWTLDDPATLAEEVSAAVAQGRARQRRPREIEAQAPVLMIPEVLTSAECEELIEVWAADHTATGVEASADGRRSEQVQAKLKRRQDHVMADRERTQSLARTIGRRVMPELARAFQYKATRFEGFKIGCYTAEDRGFFSRHRDNLSPSTAHRRFALTLNLNEDYDGGQLRFPEHSPDLYRPPAGGALIFSGSLLHEVLDVTRGRRFVLLSFLFGEEVAPS